MITVDANNIDHQRLTLYATINTWLQHTENGLNAVVHDSTPKDTSDFQSWIVESYPELFPYGYTGVHAQRARPIKLSTWIKVLLQIEDPRFRNHHDFIFTAFNYIQRQKVQESLR